MPKQFGPVPFKGTMGNLTFYKSGDGFYVKSKPVITGDRIKSDPRFARTRENMSEFATAGKAALLVRRAFLNASVKIEDGRVNNRLVKLMSTLLRRDQTSLRGQRHVVNGEATALLGFQFNRLASLETSLRVPYDVVIDKTSGTVAVNVAEFIPGMCLDVPDGATHYQLVAAGAAIDFEDGTRTSGVKFGAYCSVDSDLQAAQSLSCNIGGGTGDAWMAALGIQYFQRLGTIFYPIADGGRNALAIVKVDA